MEELLKALDTIDFYNSMSTEDFVKLFNEYTKQEVKENVIRDFKFTGLANIDLATSNFLNKHGFLDLIQFYTKKI